MSQIFESHAGQNASDGVYGNNWRCQTFTATSSHDVTSIKLFFARQGVIGVVTVSIRATDIGGQPTGVDIASGTFAASGISTSPKWHEIVLDSACNLVSGTKYAIIVRLAGGNSANEVRYYYQITGTYAGGAQDFSNTAGVTWTGLTPSDSPFEIWGSSAPSITGQSPDTDASVGDAILFSVTATGGGELTYQWNKGGLDIGGEISSTLSFTASASSEGVYNCTVTNPGGSVTTSDITLTIAPNIFSQTSDISSPLGSSTELAVVAEGSATLTYQWFKGVVAIGGETSSTYTFYAAAGHAGTYSCVVTNTAGSDTSSNIVVTVVSNPYSRNFFDLPLDADRIN